MTDVELATGNSVGYIIREATLNKTYREVFYAVSSNITADLDKIIGKKPSYILNSTRPNAAAFFSIYTSINRAVCRYDRLKKN